MPRFLAAVCLLLAGMLPCSSFALGLGEIDLSSALNQPFRAEIPVSSESADDLSGLVVELASAGTFSEFGLDRAPFLGDFKFDIQSRGGDAVIRITSVQPVVEPFVTLLLEIRWAQGRLLREYTVLLDPPVFATEVAEPAIQQPVAGPAPAPAAPAPEAAPRAVEPPPVAASPAATPRQPDTGGNYGPVQRNDTLWSIAGRFTGGTSVDRNQMMLAIYRANPEAFIGNINRLKAGMILRIPDAAELDTVGRGEANAEVRRQNAEWKRGFDESRQLRLVPPPEPDAAAEDAPGTVADAARVDAGADTAALQSRIDELETELSDNRRLLELRDQELRNLQEQLANLEDVPVEAERPVGTTPPVAAGIEDLEAGGPDTVAETPDVGPVDEVVIEPQPLTPGPDVVVTTTEPAEPSFIGRIFSSVWLYIALAVILLVGWFVVRRRAAVGGPEDSWDRLEPDADEFEAAAATLAELPETGDENFVVEEGTAAEAEAAVAADESMFAETQAAEQDEFTSADEDAELPFERTISAESAVNLDQADPIAEADFHMAYGLYDQAADLLTEALQTDPDNKDLRIKLLEVYFTWENQGGFLKEAQNLHQRIDADTDPDWNKVLIMGKQICPAEELFAAAPSAPAEEGEIDLAFGEDADLGEAAEIDITFGAADENVDLLFDDDDADVIDFSLTGEELDQNLDSPTEETPTVAADRSGKSTMETPTVETTAGDWDDDAGRSAATDEPVEQTAEIDLDDLGLDLVGPDDSDEAVIDAASVADSDLPAFDEEPSSLDETGLKPQISGEDAAAGSAEAEFASDDEVKEVLDVEPTAQMPSVADEQPMFGETVEQPAVAGDTVEQPRVAVEDEGLQQLDAHLDDDELAVELEPAQDTIASPVVEGATMTEVGTKLDLARAYIDMGDPEGARSILNEVLEEAVDSQRQEAQKLLDDLEE